MALIKCNECGRDVSDLATTCPNCGCPLKKPVASRNGTMPTQHIEPKNEGTKTMSILALIFGILGFIPTLGAIFVVVAIIISIISLAKKKAGKGMAIAGLVLGILGFIVIGASGNGAADSTPKKEATKKVTAEQEVVKEVVPTKEVQENTKDSYVVGETAEYKDIQITANGYEESMGNEWTAPSDGKVFVFVELEIVNNSNKEVNLSSMLSFENYCDDYKLEYSGNALVALSMEDNKQSLDGSVESGRKLKGNLGFEVPTDWKVIEIFYKDNAWKGSNFKFIIEK